MNLQQFVRLITDVYGIWSFEQSGPRTDWIHHFPEGPTLVISEDSSNWHSFLYQFRLRQHDEWGPVLAGYDASEHVDARHLILSFLRRVESFQTYNDKAVTILDVTQELANLYWQSKK